jgi:hypothetical protein
MFETNIRKSDYEYAKILYQVYSRHRLVFGLVFVILLVLPMINEIVGQPLPIYPWLLYILLFLPFLSVFFITHKKYLRFESKAIQDFIAKNDQFNHEINDPFYFFFIDYVLRNYNPDLDDFIRQEPVIESAKEDDFFVERELIAQILQIQEYYKELLTQKNVDNQVTQRLISNQYWKKLLKGNLFGVKSDEN